MYGGVGYSAWCEAPPKIGGCSRCARPAGTLAAEKYVLAGGAGQNMIASFSAGCGRRNSARRALPGESMERKGRLGPSGLFTGCRPDLLGVPYRASRLGREDSEYPTGNFPRPKPSPRGEGGPAKPGRMRGRSCTQPFLVEKSTLPAVASTVFFYCPVGNPIAPSSVTFGDSFPPRGSLPRCYTPATKCFLTQTPLPQNANPNQGTYMGLVIAQRSPRCAPPRQNERVGTSGP